MKWPDECRPSSIACRLDHDAFRSGRPKSIVIESKKLRRGMQAENGTLFLVPLYSAARLIRRAKVAV
ncbi:hypothetical protein GHK38_21995, partial [Sinorhizobium meliloti]|nr:hypothetical protein [Sinorhizobium meliloti]